ncbi:MAG: FHA domain-containing protein, partial [Fervidobacterium pennivorans]
KTAHKNDTSSNNNESIDTEKTVIASRFIILRGSLFNIVVKPGEIVGRHFNGAEHLQQYKTVSRSHAMFTEQMHEWYIEDLGSTNGTYLNGEKLEPGRKYKIKNGDMIALSTEVKFTVEIKQ